MQVVLQYSITITFNMLAMQKKIYEHLSDLTWLVEDMGNIYQNFTNKCAWHNLQAQMKDLCVI